jgi:peptide methionine sulfoxide reductase MsrB
MIDPDFTDQYGGPVEVPPDHVHEWIECDAFCEDCGSHPGLRCEECDAVIDLIYEDDPREEISDE